VNDLPYILASQLGTIREMQIQQQQRAAMQDARNLQNCLRSGAYPPQMRAVSYHSGAAGIAGHGGAGGVGYLGSPGESGAALNLEAVPEHVDQAQAFVARQLVAQAQSDYRVAVERGKVAEAEAARVRMEVAVALEEANTQRARADKAEAELRTLQPLIRRKYIAPASSSPGSYELKWPWLAVSWAFVIAGVGVCLL
jgi:hypothetical protein